MKRKAIIAAALAAAALAACSKTAQVPAPQDGQDITVGGEKMGRLLVRFSGSDATKSALDTTETKIKKYLIGVYDIESKKVNVTPIENTTAHKGAVVDTVLNVPYGMKKVVVWANHVQDYNITWSDAIYNYCYTDLCDTHKNPGYFVMAGVADSVMVDSPVNKMSVTLKRVVAKITVGSIATDFKGTNYSLVMPNIKVNGVYIGNAVRWAALDGTPLLADNPDREEDDQYIKKGLWYNAYTPGDSLKVDSDVSSLTAHSFEPIELAKHRNTISDSDFTALNKTLYTHPNTSEDTPTYLVIGVLYEGKQLFYRYKFSEIKANTHYKIDKIRIKGAPDTGGLACDVSLGSWDDNNDYAELVL